MGGRGGGKLREFGDSSWPPNLIDFVMFKILKTNLLFSSKTTKFSRVAPPSLPLESVTNLVVLV